MTKRRDLVRLLVRNGFAPDGGTKHERFLHPDGRKATVPRHREIPDEMAEKIKREVGIGPVR